MIRRPPRSTRTDTLFPYTALFRSDSEGATYLAYGHAPLPTGVRSYSWSPDGRWLWYVVLDAERYHRKIRYDADVASERAQRRSPGRATALIFLRGPQGKDRLLAKRPHGDISTFFRSEEHTSELQSLMRISYAVFCLKKKKNNNTQ